MERKSSYLAGNTERSGNERNGVYCTGKHQAVVCNYRSVLRYEKEEIILLTFQGKLRIQGKRLKIPMYTPEEMYIEGVITEIILEG